MCGQIFDYDNRLFSSSAIFCVSIVHSLLFKLLKCLQCSENFKLPIIIQKENNLFAGENNIMAVCLFYVFIFPMKSRLLHVNQYRITLFKLPTVCLHGNNFTKIFYWYLFFRFYLIHRVYSDLGCGHVQYVPFLTTQLT